MPRATSASRRRGASSWRCSIPTTCGSPTTSRINWTCSSGTISTSSIRTRRPSAIRFAPAGCSWTCTRRRGPVIDRVARHPAVQRHGVGAGASRRHSCRRVSSTSRCAAPKTSTCGCASSMPGGRIGYHRRLARAQPAAAGKPVGRRRVDVSAHRARARQGGARAAPDPTQQALVAGAPRGLCRAAAAARRQARVLCRRLQRGGHGPDRGERAIFAGASSRWRWCCLRFVPGLLLRAYDLRDRLVFRSVDTMTDTNSQRNCSRVTACRPPTHADEVARGERFEFGKNWARFLRVIDDERIGQAGAVAPRDARSRAPGRAPLPRHRIGQRPLQPRRPASRRRRALVRLRPVFGRLHARAQGPVSPGRSPAGASSGARFSTRTS